MSESYPYERAGQQPRQRELDLFDLVAFVWTQKLLALLIAIIVFIPLAFLAWNALTPTYEAQSRLLVILDGSDSAPDTAGAGGAFIIDQVMESEREILVSNEVGRRALESRGAFATSSQVNALQQGLSVSRAPNASVLVSSFEDADPNVAANTLNALIDAYLEYRVELLVGAPGEGVEERLAAAEAEAARAEAELRAFLNEHDLVDFAAERTSLLTRINDLEARVLSAQAESSSARRFAQALEQRLRSIPESIELYVENSVRNELLELEVTRQELLSRYQPSAPPVLAIERQIAALSAFIEAGGAEGMGQRRTGVNPVWQAVQSERLQQESFAASQGQLAASLQRQVDTARENADRLRGLAPEHDRLARAATARSEAAELLSAQAASASARRNAQTGGADAVRVVERASPPSQASSLRVPAVMAMAVFAVGLGVLVAMLRGYLVSRHTYRPPHRPDPAPRPSSEIHGTEAHATAAPGHGGAPAHSQPLKAKPQARRKLPVLAHVGR